MSYITINIDIDNDAFADNREMELARILNYLSNKVQNDSSFHYIRDINGNVVGELNSYR